MSAASGFGVAVLLTGGAMAVQSPPPPPIDQLVRDLQAKYNSVRDFSADFEHQYSGGLLSVAVVEYGTVEIKKPGKMRWHYTTSEEKLYVSDGEMFYSYYPLDRQVTVARVPSEDRASTAVLFLAGRGSLADDFSATYADGLFPLNVWVVRFTPHIAKADYEWLTVTVDRQSLSITGLSTEDFQGGQSTYLFSNLEENRGLADSHFDFTIPDNTEVITEDAFAR